MTHDSDNTIHYYQSGNAAGYKAWMENPDGATVAFLTADTNEWHYSW